jgi:hypothetical protein
MTTRTRKATAAVDGTDVTKECPRCGPLGRLTGEFCDTCNRPIAVPAMTPKEAAELERGLKALREQAERDGWKRRKPDSRGMSPGKASR